MDLKLMVSSRPKLVLETCFQSCHVFSTLLGTRCQLLLLLLNTAWTNFPEHKRLESCSPQVLILISSRQRRAYGEKETHTNVQSGNRISPHNLLFINGISNIPILKSCVVLCKNLKRFLKPNNFLP